MRALVEKAVDANLETKQVIFDFNQPAAFDGIIDQARLWQIIPPCPQGGATGFTRSGRVGAQIELMSITIKGVVVLAGSTDANSSTIQGRLMCLSSKSFKDSQNVFAGPISSGIVSHLLRNQQSAEPYDGSWSNHLLPLNTPNVTKHWERYMDFNNQYTSGPAPLADVTRSIVKHFTIRLKCRGKKLRYDADAPTNVYPTNYAPFLCFGWTCANGNTAFPSTPLMQVRYQVHMNYKDA